MRIARTLPAALVTLALASLAAAVCREGRNVRHERLQGSFDLTTTAYDGGAASCLQSGPPVQMWIASRGVYLDEGVPEPCYEWLLSARGDLGLPAADPARWVAVYPSWGCEAGANGLRDGGTLETSFPDALREGTPDHRGLYLVAIPGASCGADDLDLVADAGGALGNVVTAEEIPPPEADPLLLPNGRDPAFVDVTCTLRPVWSHGPAGHPEAIRGHRLVYMAGSPVSEATSSDPSAWLPVLDPADPTRPLGTIALGTGSARGAVPKAASSETYVDLALQVVYEEGALDVASRATSSHRRSQTGTPAPAYPDLALQQLITPMAPAPGTPVTLRLELTNRSAVAAAVGARLWANLLDLPAGCLDLATASISCPGCDTAALDPVSGKLSASRAALAPGERIALTLVADAGPGSGGSCASVAWADAERHRYVRAASSFDNSREPVLLRSTARNPPGGRPRLDRVFPLRVFLAPSPAFPFGEEAQLLTDTTRSLVFWRETIPGPLYVVKALATGSVLLLH